MVAIKTNTISTETKLQFTHFVDFPKREYTIGTAKDESNNTKVYLIFKNHGRIYNRHGLNDTWVELEVTQREHIHQLAEEALYERHVPCFIISGNNGSNN